MQRFKNFINSLLILLNAKTKQVEEVVNNEAKKQPIDFKTQIKELENKLELAKNAHLEAVVEINLYKQKHKDMLMAILNWKTCSQKANEKFMQTKDGLFEAKSKEAFMMYKECVAKLEVIDKSIEVLSVAETKLRIVKDNSASIISKAKIKLMKIEGQENVNKVMRRLTDGLSDIVNIDVEECDNITREHLKHEEVLKELLVHTEVTSSTDFDDEYSKFIGGK